jgi:hypothetical protein
MYLFKLFTYLLFLLPLVSCYSRSLYIDKSCTTKDGWENYWKETEEFASQALKRMKDKSDTDFAAVFTRIFQTTKGSKDGAYVES